jgi:hypothetical protein
VIDRRELPSRADRWQALGRLTARAKCWPRRKLPAGAIVMPQGEHMPPPSAKVQGGCLPWYFVRSSFGAGKATMFS